MAIRARIRELEALRPGRTLALSASRLDLDLLPPLYETLRTLGRAERLNVVVQCRGGEVNAARRIALLLHEFADRLTFVVPHCCESAGTVMALAAHEIVAGPMAIFSPIDPHLSADGAAGSGPSAMSAEDIRQCWRMMRDWFGLDEGEAKARALQLLGENIFPTTLTSFHRSTRELERIGAELLARHMGDRPPAIRAEIVSTLLYGFDSHAYALTADDLRGIGLPVVRDARVDAVAWEIVRALRRIAGPESREREEADWHDAAIATVDGVQRRLRRMDVPCGVWEPVP